MEKTGDEYIVVATGEAAKSFNGIYIITYTLH